MPTITDPHALAAAIEDAASLMLRWGHGQLRQLPAEEVEMILAALRAKPVAEGEATHLAALNLVRAMIRGEQIEHAVVHMNEPDVGLGAWLDRLPGMNKERT